MAKQAKELFGGMLSSSTGLKQTEWAWGQQVSDVAILSLLILSFRNSRHLGEVALVPMLPPDPVQGGSHSYSGVCIGITCRDCHSVDFWTPNPEFLVQ